MAEGRSISPGTGQTAAGTGNDFIKSAGIPNDPEKALEVIFSGKAEAYERKEREIVSLDAAERLAESLGIDRDFVQKGGDSVWAEIHGQEEPEDDNGAGILIRQLMIAADSRKYGAWRDIPEEIWMAIPGITMETTCSIEMKYTLISPRILLWLFR